MLRSGAAVLQRAVARHALCAPIAHYHPKRALCASSEDDDDLAAFCGQKGVVLLDVRTKDELISKRLPTALHLSMQDIPDKLDELPIKPDTPLCVFCAAGKRAALTKSFLERIGYSNVYNGGSIAAVAAATGVKVVSSAESATAGGA